MKVITYNIDGLPDKLDLKSLPWILKPISWIYKWIKGTTVIKINDNTETSNNIKKISKYLRDSGADIIGVQEDFNYHSELLFYLNNYLHGELSNKFDLSGIFKDTEWKSYFPLPRFKSDGINLLAKFDTVDLNLVSEEIVSWKESYGYIDHANDLLTHKGFRFYTIKVENKEFDIYVIHMDADFYHESNCPDVSKDIRTRKAQFKQLHEFISNRYNNGRFNPTIIMGDTNSYDKYYWDTENINLFKLNIKEISPNISIEEAIPGNFKDCDRIFYINSSNLDYRLELLDCYFDISLELSDHKPLIANFNIIK